MKIRRRLGWPHLLTGALAVAEACSTMLAACGTHWDPAVQDYWIPDPWGYICLGLIIPLGLSPALWGWKPRRRKKKAAAKEQPVPDGRINVPASYFMPYSVCPRCDTEGLHWFRPIKTEADLSPGAIDAKMYGVEFSKEMRSVRPKAYAYEDDADYKEVLAAWQERCRKRAIGYLLAGEARFDVMRTCISDDCKHVWGQTVGPLVSADEVA